MDVTEPGGVGTFPTGKYMIPDKDSELVEENYDSFNNQYLQPMPNGKWHDNKFDKLMQNKDYANMYNFII